MGGHLLYDPYGGENLNWNYRFRSVPGMQELHMKVAGTDLKVWLNGKSISRKNIKLLSKDSLGISNYSVTFPKVQKKVGIVAFSLKRKPGYQGAAVICEPIIIKTRIGLMEAGNWSETGALKYYSGGLYYRKQVSIPKLHNSSRVVLDLGDVSASCEIKVNGVDAGIMMNPPYKKDISKYVKSGDNELEVLVYSTLSNHYQTVPTPYRGDGKAGLLGPVSLNVFE